MRPKPSSVDTEVAKAAPKIPQGPRLRSGSIGVEQDLDASGSHSGHTERAIPMVSIVVFRNKICFALRFDGLERMGKLPLETRWRIPQVWLEIRRHCSACWTPKRG